jgi:hypothetical protein
MEEKLGQEPAFPFESKEYGNVGINETGMSKRFYAACAAMQGLLSNQSYFVSSAIRVVEDSYKIADELLKQENS